MKRAIAWEDAEKVASDVCERHRKNMCMLRDSDDPVEAIQWLKYTRTIGYSFWKGTDPVAIGGIAVTHPGNASTFFFGTPRWPERVIEITRFFHVELYHLCRLANIRRLSVFAPAGDPDGERWKRLMGCELEATLKNYGKNGEDFSLFRVLL